MIPIRALILETIQSPEQAAQKITSLRLSNEVILTSFALVQVLNAMVISLQSVIILTLGGFGGILTGMQYLMLNVAVQLMLAGALTVTGRWMNGVGSYGTILTGMTWVSFVQAVLLGPISLLLFVSPPLTGILSLVVVVGAIYVLLHFINAAHQFGSLWRAAGALLMSIAASSLIFSFVLQPILIGQL